MSAKSLTTIYFGCSKGNAISLEAWTGPEGSRRLRLLDFNTIGTRRWYSGQPYTPATVTLRKYSWYSLWSKGMCQLKIPMTPSGIERANLRLVAKCLIQLRHRVHPSVDVLNSRYFLGETFASLRLDSKLFTVLFISFHWNRHRCLYNFISVNWK
jgi:hypothetical protein